MLIPLLASLTLCLLAWKDLTHRRLSNRVVGLYAALFLPYAWLAGLSAGQAGGHVLVAGLAFLVLLGLFMAGGMAGGDVKLGTAVLLWAGPPLGFPVVAVIAWTGGVVAVLCWLADRSAVRRLALAFRPLRRARRVVSARRGVPYGVALAAGGLYVMWRQTLF